MPWFKVDDALHSHPKSRRAGMAAMGLWVVAGSYAAQYVTEGFVPDWFVQSWPNGRKCARQLVNADLWSEGVNGSEAGWWFHDWDHFQMSKEEVERDRESNRERQRKFREKRREARSNAVRNGVSNAVSNGVTPPVTNAVSNGTPTQPVPTRPDPAYKERPPTVDAPTGTPTAQTLVAEWLEHCPERPPGAVVGQASKHIKAMLDEGVHVERVRAGLAEWNRKGLHPSALPSVVHEVQVKQAAGPSGDSASWMRRRAE